MANLVKRDGDIIWPQQNLQAQVFNTDKPAIAFAEAAAAIPALAWLFPDVMTARLEAMVDAAADDKIALGHSERQEREADLREKLLEVERQEAFLVWKAQAQNLPAEHMADCHPLAILGGQLRTILAGDPSPGSSPEHASYNLIGSR